MLGGIKMIRKISFVLAVLTTLLLATEVENVLDPCQLLTKQEVEKVLKRPMKAGKLGKSNALFGTLSCSYLSVDRFDNSASAVLNIGTTTFMKENDAVFESAKEKYEKEKNAYMGALKRQNKADTFEAVKGLGDEAYWGTVSLHIFKGDTFINIKISASAGMRAKSSQEMEKMVKKRNLTLSKEIAQIILQKLEQTK